MMFIVLRGLHGLLLVVAGAYATYLILNEPKPTAAHESHTAYRIRGAYVTGYLIAAMFATVVFHLGRDTSQGNFYCQLHGGLLRTLEGAQPVYICKDLTEITPVAPRTRSLINQGRHE